MTSAMPLGDYEAKMHAERREIEQSRWPRIDDAWGCLDCKLMFRRLPVNPDGEDTAARRADPHECPYCRSESIFNAAAVINRERMTVEQVVEIAHEMITTIDGALGDE